jgi:hypothetical protein
MGGGRKEVVTMSELPPGKSEKEHLFWRALVLPEEDRMQRAMTPSMGYRWFRSDNITPIEQWRRPLGECPDMKVG